MGEERINPERKANFSFTKKASVTPVTTRFSFRSVNGEVTMG